MMSEVDQYWRQLEKDNAELFAAWERELDASPEPKRERRAGLPGRARSEIEELMGEGAKARRPADSKEPKIAPLAPIWSHLAIRFEGEEEPATFRFYAKNVDQAVVAAFFARLAANGVTLDELRRVCGRGRPAAADMRVRFLIGATALELREH